MAEEKKGENEEDEGESENVSPVHFSSSFFPPLFASLLSFSHSLFRFLRVQRAAQIGVNRVRARHPASPVRAG